MRFLKEKHSRSPPFQALGQGKGGVERLRKIQESYSKVPSTEQGPQLPSLKGSTDHGVIVIWGKCHYF